MTSARACAVHVGSNVGRAADVALAGNAPADLHSSIEGAFYYDDVTFPTVTMECVELTEFRRIYSVDVR